MAGYYLDTSALVKRYRQEQGSDVVDRLFAEPQAILIISRLAIVETSSALAMHVRTGELQLADYAFARKKLLGDVALGDIKAVRLLARHYQTAEQIIERHSPLRRQRTLDALQLGVAIDCHRQGRIGTFVCADSSLCEVAALEGMPVENPVATNKGS